MNQLSKIQLNERIHAIKARVKAVKPLLPKDWRKRLVKLHPELVASEKVNFLGNIIMQKTFDETITESLEKIAVEYLKELAIGSFQNKYIHSVEIVFESKKYLIRLSHD